MKFFIAPEIFAVAPDLVVGVLSVRNMDNTGSASEITQLLRASEESIVQKLDLETFKQHPNIAAVQEVHRAFGNNPNKYPPSIQALVKRILKGGQLPTINPLVDLYNIISLKYIVCAGAESTDPCQGDIRLAPADGTEEYRALGEEEDDPPQPGEWVYKDDIGAICRKLNWREAKRTMTSPETKNAVCVLEGFPPVDADTIKQALEELDGLLEKYCGGERSVTLLTKENPSVEL